ncbi:MAG TPA: hypothetical protein VK772_07480 [Puia sp.]|jgi:hypothetical protein|nr:hypothetical protein [Puia sp.]
MIINFRETYKSLSTAELLNIIHKPDDYQPQAVLAANEILKERSITDADIADAERITEDIKNYWINEKEVLNNVSSKIENLADPIVNPVTTVNTKKWISILIVTIAVYSTWMLIELTIQWRRWSELNRTEHFNWGLIIEPAYLLVTLGGLYKRKKWGWMLLMILFVIQLIGAAIGVFLSFRYSFFHRDIGASVFSILLYGVTVYLLSQKDTRTYFSISDKFFRNTIFSGIILFLAIQVFFRYFYA